MSQAIKRQEALQRSEHQWWTRLKQLADANDIKGFYACYAVYLESQEIVSGHRKVLHKMAKLVSM